MKKSVLMIAVLLLVGFNSSARAAMRITEWMYQGFDDVGEFIEFTNVGTTPIDMTGWSFDDDSRIPGVFDLSPFGLVAPGESVVITESSAVDFRANWSLDPAVKVLGEYTNNLGRADEINLFDSLGALADRLGYADNDDDIGGPRTQRVSGNPISLDALGANDATLWKLAELGDAYGSYVSLNGELGNPGIGNYAVPEPSSIVMGVLGSLALCACRVYRGKRRG